MAPKLTPEQAKHIAAKAVPPSDWGSLAQAQFHLWRAATAPLQAAYKALGHNYLAPGTDGTEGKVARFVAFAGQHAGHFEAPFAVFEMAGDALGVCWGIGKHRFCALRDSGVKEIVFATEGARAQIALQAGLKMEPVNDAAKDFAARRKQQRDDTRDNAKLDAVRVKALKKQQAKNAALLRKAQGK